MTKEQGQEQGQGQGWKVILKPGDEPNTFRLFIACGGFGADIAWTEPLSDAGVLARFADLYSMLLDEVERKAEEEAQALGPVRE